MIYYLTALGFGLMSGLHCIGMCGPIAMAIPIKSPYRIMRWVSSLSYLFGKAFTYALLGILTGLLAESLIISGAQKYLSLIAGGLILLILFFQYVKIPQLLFLRKSTKHIHLLKNFFSVFIQKNNPFFNFLIGVVNGLLPCGMVYMALAGSVGAGGWWQSMLYMFIFGLGTMPLMLLLLLFKNNLNLTFRLFYQKAIPVFSFVIALLLLYRGLNVPLGSHNDTSANNKNTIECVPLPKQINN